MDFFPLQFLNPALSSRGGGWMAMFGVITLLGHLTVIGFLTDPDSTYCRSQERVEPCLHYPLHLNGVVYTSKGRLTFNLASFGPTV
jgi:hypothetical protein